MNDVNSIFNQVFQSDPSISKAFRDAVAPRVAKEERAAETALQSAIRNAGLDMAALPKSKREQILKAMRCLYWSAVSEGLSVRAEIDRE